MCYTNPLLQCVTLLHWSTVLHWSTKFSTAPQTFIGMITVISPDSKVLSTNQLLCHTLLMTTNQPGYNYQGWSLDRLFHAWLRLGIVWLLLKYLKGKLFQKWPRSEKCTSHNTQHYKHSRPMHVFPNMRIIRCVKGRRQWGENRWGFGTRSKIICFSPWLPTRPSSPARSLTLHRYEI